MKDLNGNPNINTTNAMSVQGPTTPLTRVRNASCFQDMDDISEMTQKQAQVNITKTLPMPILFKCVTTPSFPSYKPQEQRLPKPKNSSLITAVELGKYLLEHKSSDYLLLDIRPFTEHAKAVIINSIHVCLPSTLLRRKNFTFEKLLEGLPNEERQYIVSRFNNPNLRIFLYDNSSQQIENSISLACHGILTKLLNYVPVMNCITTMRISVLSCRFGQFKDIFPHCISYTGQHSSSELIQANDDSIELPPNGGYYSPLKNDVINLRLSVSDVNGSISSSSFANSPSPQNMLPDSPISSSSPISSLLKFQLPSQKTIPPQLFKFTQNEELMNLESYLSAVDINEEQSKINSLYESNEAERNKIGDEARHSLHTFEFPKKTSNPDLAQTDDERFKDKLSVQIKYLKLLSHYSQEQIDSSIPKWFQELMSRTKVQFASQFQKLDILEKRRLNSSISTSTNSNGSSMSIATENIPITTSKSSSKSSSQSILIHVPYGHKHNDSDTTANSSTSFSTLITPPMPPFSKLASYPQKRSHSQPDSLNSINQKWLRDIDSDLNEFQEDDEKIVISSGVELGSKNRYKDIFPYEHTRVILKKPSFSSDSSSPHVAYNNVITQEISEDKELEIWDNYINANYLILPKLEISDELLNSARSKKLYLPAASKKVRYIATQGPMLSTVFDFYTCIINDRVPLILALTNEFENGIEKCCQYWEEADYNGIRVTIIEESKIPELNNNLVIRRIQLTYENGSKQFEVIQLQIKNWLDFGTLSDPIEIIYAICFKNLLMDALYKNGTFSDKNLPTILVHCSAGCGRTGTWCTIDSILSNMDNFDLFQTEFKKEHSGVDKIYDPVAWTINIFRKQRISMVQNINQFLFIYDCLLYFFNLQMNDHKIRRSKLKMLMDNKKSVCYIDKQISKLDVINRFADKKSSEIETIA